MVNSKWLFSPMKAAINHFKRATKQGPYWKKTSLVRDEKLETKLPTQACFKECTLRNLTTTRVIPVTLMIYLDEASPKVYKNENRLVEGDRRRLKSADIDKHAFCPRKVSLRGAARVPSLLTHHFTLKIRGTFELRLFPRESKTFSHTFNNKKKI